MNVTKRNTALKSILARASSNSAKATRIAAELTTSFKGQKTPAAKAALKLAQTAAKLAAALKKAASAVSL
jgi:hypothetical protein